MVRRKNTSARGGDAAILAITPSQMGARQRSSASGPSEWMAPGRSSPARGRSSSLCPAVRRLLAASCSSSPLADPRLKAEPSASDPWLTRRPSGGCATPNTCPLRQGIAQRQDPSVSYRHAAADHGILGCLHHKRCLHLWPCAQAHLLCLAVRSGVLRALTLQLRHHCDLWCCLWLGLRSETGCNQPPWAICGLTGPSPPACITM
jgi:hypothetical protein